MVSTHYFCSDYTGQSHIILYRPYRSLFPIHDGDIHSCRFNSSSCINRSRSLNIWPLRDADLLLVIIVAMGTRRYMIFFIENRLQWCIWKCILRQLPAMFKGFSWGRVQSIPVVIIDQSHAVNVQGHRRTKAGCQTEPPIIIYMWLHNLSMMIIGTANYNCTITVMY